MKRQYSVLATTAALAVLAAYSTAAPVAGNRALPDATSLALAAPVQGSRKVDPALANAKGEVVTTTVQTILDQLMPGLVPLLMTFACMALLKRKVNAIWVIFGLFAIGIIGYALGILTVK